MDSVKITTTFNNEIIVKGESCMDGFLKLPLDNVVTRISRKHKVCVSVGIFIPPSMIKILLLHCILGVSSDQLHSIRIMDHLMAVAYYHFSLMVFTCWPIFTSSSHLQSFSVFTSAKAIFRVLGLIRSRVCH